ncbi:TPA: helix-turn-helix domain-containing protein [Campylobacter coli]|nr:helix-turn-helix domain-containing protein [Campylobacter coli]
MILSKILKEHRSQKNWTQEDLANYSGVSLPTIKRYEAGSDNATTTNLKKIADAFEVDISNFLSPNLSPKSKKNVSQSTNLSKNLSPNQTNLKNISKSTNQQEVLNHNNDSSLVVRKSTDKNVRKSFVSDGKMSVNQTNLKVKNSAQTLSDDMINIPFFENVRASAGSGAYNDEYNEQTMSLSKGFLRECFGLYSFANLSVILGQGDSMAPTLPENCYLLIQQGEVKEGEICVTRIEDELYVKRLQKRPKLKLLSDNKAYEPIDLEGENFEILGRVVGYFKKTTL